jgi:outer membrane protein assembly factor BamE (lipoprotein component of BamABCDE complex)
MLYNTRWKTSETKKIYQATKNSQILMEYLEVKLMQRNLVSLIGELPSTKRGYGVLIYYYSKKPKKRLLSSAPRKNHDHIHIVLFNNVLSIKQIQDTGFDLGNTATDIKIHTKSEIDTLVDLLKINLQKV